MMSGLADFSYEPPKQFPADFVGGQIFREADLWREQLDYVVSRGLPVPAYVRRMIKNGEVDLYDPDLYDASLPAVQHKKKYESLEAMERKYRQGGPTSNYQSFIGLDGNVRESFIGEMLDKRVVVGVRDDEIRKVLFNPVGSVEKDGKLRMTFHSLMNCYFRKVKISLNQQMVGVYDLREFEAADAVDLKKYYYWWVE